MPRVAIVVLLTVFSVGCVALGVAAGQRPGGVQQFEGQIRSVQLDCKPPLRFCEGAIVLAERRGGEVTLAVRAGTWIRRAERILTVDDLEIGASVKAQAFRMDGEALPRAALIEFSDRDMTESP